MSLVTIPYHLKYGKPGGNGHWPIDELGYVELRKARSGKKYYARVVDDCYESYNMDMTFQAIERKDRRFEWAVAAILQHAYDWGDLEANSMPLIILWDKNPEKFPGIIMDSNEWFSFDPETITLKSANLFLAAVEGSIRIW